MSGLFGMRKPVDQTRDVAEATCRLILVLDGIKEGRLGGLINPKEENNPVAKATLVESSSGYVCLWSQVEDCVCTWRKANDRLGAVGQNTSATKGGE